MGGKKKVGRNEICHCGSRKKFKHCHGAPDVGKISKGEHTNTPPRLLRPYSELPEIAAARRVQIIDLCRLEFEFVDDCLALAAQVVEALGDIEPKTSEEVAIRDLACDAFDFLYASKETLAENSVTVVFPLMRRAYEDISLLAAFVSNRSLASRWASGGRIKNEDVRKQLETSPLMGPGEVQQIKDMYRHFSSGTHPNRTHLPFSFLGQGNMFTLGAIPPVDALIIGGHLQYLMGLAYWYIGVLGWEFAPTCMSVGGDFTRFVLGLTPRINELMPRLIQQLEAMRNSAGEPPGDIGPRDLIE